MIKKTVDIPDSILQAENITYDNTKSGLESTTAQNAIDEVYAKVNTNSETISNVDKKVNDNTEAISNVNKKVDDVTNKVETDITAHTNNKSNPHEVTKDQVGLGNVDNTSDTDKPVSTAQQQAIDSAKSEAISTADKNAKSYTDEKIESIIDGASSAFNTLKEIEDELSKDDSLMGALEKQLNTKVDAEYVKNEIDSLGTLSKKNNVEETDLDADLKDKINTISEGQHTHPNKTDLDSITSDKINKWDNHVNNKSNPHEVTKYQVGLGNVPNVSTNDQTPTFIEANARANIASGETLNIILGKISKFFIDLKTVAFSGSYNDLTNKPTIPTKLSQLTNDSGYKTTDTNTWIAFQGATTSAAGTAGYAPAPSAGAANRYFRSDGTWSVPPDTNTTYGVVSSSANGLMTPALLSKLNGIASGAQVNAVTSVAGKTGAVTLSKSDVGLGSVDNTADSTKSVNYANSAGSASSSETAKKLNNIYSSRPSSANLAVVGDGSLKTFKATSSMTTGKPPQDAHLLHMEWDNTGGYSGQIGIGTTGDLYTRYQSAGSWQSWRTVLDSFNYTSYVPTKTGSGASGTWGINITGSAGSATKATQDSAGQQINTTYLKGLSVSGQTITYTKGDGTTGTITTQDTNTWRGIQNNLTSTATDQSLSANQGRLLANGSARDSTKLPLSGGVLSGKISLPSSALLWIDGMTLGNASVSISTQQTAQLYHPYFAVKTSGNHIFNIGGLGDTVGFYGYKSGRTANGTDWQFTANASTGEIYSTGAITAPTFKGSLSGNATSASNASNADTLDGYHGSSAQSANTYVLRNGNGYVNLNYINSNTGNNENPSISQVVVTNGSDHYYRKASLGHLKSSLGSMPASDVYAWAKASKKPSYAWSEITEKPSTFTPATHTHNYAGSSSAGGAANSANFVNVNSELAYGVNGLQYFNQSTSTTSGATANANPTNGWYHIIRMNHANSAGYFVDLAAGLDNGNGLYHRRVTNGSETTWRRLLDSANYTLYCLPSTTKYAGASTAGGSATSAAKLDVSTGSATNPVYFSNGIPVSCSYTLGKSVPSNAVFTDTNTWRGIQNNLTSTSTTDSLSAAQGKALKDLYNTLNIKSVVRKETTVTTGSTGNINTGVTSTDTNFIVGAHLAGRDAYVRAWVTSGGIWYLTVCNPNTGATINSTSVNVRYTVVTLNS